MQRKKFKKLVQYFLIISAIFSYSISSAQNINYTIHDWVKVLSETNNNNNNSISLLIDALVPESKQEVTGMLDEIERKGGKNANYFQARLKSVKAYEISGGKYPGDQAKAKQLLAEALHHAYETGNDVNIGYVCWIYGVVMFTYQEIDLATVYLLKTAEINEGLPEKLKNYEYRVFLGELLFHIQDYEKSIYYTSAGLNEWTDKSRMAWYYKMKA